MSTSLTISAAKPELSCASIEPSKGKDSLALDRKTIARLLESAEAHQLDLVQIQSALERADYDDAACRLLARLKLGLPIPPKLTADALVGARGAEVFCVLAMAGGTEMVEPLLDLVRKERFPDGPLGGVQLLYSALILERLGALEVARDVLLPRLRRLARKPWLPPWTAALYGFVVARMDDPDLSTVYESYRVPVGPLSTVLGEFTLQVLQGSVDDAIESLPQLATATVLPGAPLRVGPKIGRNDPCPCGSGKKLKRCCGPMDPNAGVASNQSLAAQLRELEPRLSHEQVRQLPPLHLARLDLTRLSDLAVIGVMRSWTYWRNFPRAAAAVDELYKRDHHDAEGHGSDLVNEAFRAGHVEDALSIADRLAEIDIDTQLRLDVARNRGGAFAKLEEAALEALSEPDRGGEIEVAFALLEVAPALGILVARGALWPDRLFDGETLIEATEEARDQLLLPPGDRAQDIYKAVGGQVERQQADESRDEENKALLAKASELQRKLSEATGRVGELQRQVGEHERALQTATAAADRVRRGAAATPDVPTADLQRLQGKVEELKGLLRERNAERTDLRRQLADAAHDSNPARAEAHRRSRRDADEEAGDVAVEPLAGRPVLIPYFNSDFRSTLDELPRHVAAETVRTVGSLAASDHVAWRGVKQAKDMTRPVLMARIGIHHRLLFRVEEGELHVIDVVPRENLQLVLKRLRG